MRNATLNTLACVLLLGTSALAVPAPAPAKIVPDDTLTCTFVGSASAWAWEDSTSSGAALEANASCVVQEEDGSPAPGAYAAELRATGAFTGGPVAAQCLHGSLDGTFTLEVHDGAATVETHYGDAHIQFGYGATFGDDTWGWYDTTSAPGHIQMANVTDGDGHWGGSGEGVIQVIGYCGDNVGGTFAVHI